MFLIGAGCSSSTLSCHSTRILGLLPIVWAMAVVVSTGVHNAEDFMGSAQGNAGPGQHG